jgi:hypothetical protein
MNIEFENYWSCGFATPSIIHIIIINKRFAFELLGFEISVEW